MSHYLEGKLEGLYQYWWNNGKKMTECTYLDDKLEGLYKRWNINGEKVKDCHYRDGKEVEMDFIRDPV